MIYPGCSLSPVVECEAGGFSGKIPDRMVQIPAASVEMVSAFRKAASRWPWASGWT